MARSSHAPNFCVSRSSSAARDAARRLAPLVAWCLAALLACGGAEATSTADAGVAPGTDASVDVGEANAPLDAGAPDHRASESLSHVPFTDVPPLVSGGITHSPGTEWVNGETRLVKDNHGAGELFGLRWDADGANMYLFASGDRGATWRMVATQPTNPCSGSCFTFPSAVFAMTQDKDGKVHAIASGTHGDRRQFYLRFNLTRDPGGQLTGFTLETPAPILLPDHNRLGLDLRGDIKLVDRGGKEVLVYIVDLSNVSAQSSRDIKVYMAQARTLAPMTTSDFLDLSGAPGDTLVFDSCLYPPNCDATSGFFSTHNLTGLFSQNRATGDLYVVIGPIEADFGFGYPIDQANKLRSIRLSATANGWSVGKDAVRQGLNTSGYLPLLFSTASGTNHAWMMYLHPDNGLTFGSFAADGSYAESAVAHPFPAKNHNGWGTFNVGADDVSIWAIWQLSIPDAKEPKTAQGFWNGTSWKVFDDTLTTGAHSGIGGVSGWDEGVAALLFRGGLLRPNPPLPQVATIWGR